MADLRRLPNLAALRAFEAAARHENFSRAAEEIHVTHGAISHQVRALEEELGVALFARHGKRIAITPEGERFAATLRRALGDIAAAAEALRADGKQQRLTITALPSFAGRWLSPRLGRFIEQHPELEVMLQSSNHLTDFVRESVDVGIRFGKGHYAGLASEKLMDDYYYPVASPRFNDGKLPKSPATLARGMLLRCEGEPWTPWFHAAGLDLPEPTGGLVFQDSSMLVRAAAEGHGIALARHAIAMTELASGELVRLFDTAIQCPHSYYVVCPPDALQKPQVRAFRQWLFDEAAKLGPP
ncbi:transcriptional regulator GcvA [Noviherbaspirillum autotrophicum]|uniref:XRE family transcriptional regulator n=1 Tax=Noviherbaspirillum autotrophicum TaxID=709839 RepID=A0A0C1Y7X9_9BURK|nr:transcriptional regulator GcvA [Noviherbaspirillum autotrophicum]KIF83003.1 XRE family transcriptional regulator [Noviherbaspirillum autotrophicum]